MTGFSDWWWIGALAIGIGLLVGASTYAVRRRRREFAQKATELGLTRVRVRPVFSKEQRKRVSLFRRGIGRNWSNVFSDVPDIGRVVLFDYRYTFGIPHIAARTYSQTVAAFSARMTNLPDFQLAPATVVDRAAPSLGLQAIQLESRPEFGKQYWLRGRDEIAIRALFSDPLVDRFRALDVGRRWSIEKGADWLVVFSWGRVVPAGALPDFLRTSEMIANLFLQPNHVSTYPST